MTRSAPVTPGFQQRSDRAPRHSVQRPGWAHLSCPVLVNPNHELCELSATHRHCLCLVNQGRVIGDYYVTPGPQINGERAVDVLWRARRCDKAARLGED